MIKIKLDELPKDKALELVADKIKSCRRCRLAQTRNKTVPGHGNPGAEVMFIGEGPGFNEDQQGIPFCGRAGKLLDQALTMVSWSRADVFITNIVKCRPPNNRDPEADENAACQVFLDKQILIVKPKMIVTLGRFSMAKFLANVKISQVHGQVYPTKWRSLEFIVVPLYHPAAALRNGKFRQIFMSEFKQLPGYLKLAKQNFWALAQDETLPVTQPEATRPEKQLKLL